MLETPVGVGCQIELAMSSGGPSIRALGRVIYELALRSARLQVGVEFLRVAPEDRGALTALVEEQLASPTV